MAATTPGSYIRGSQARENEMTDEELSRKRKEAGRKGGKKGGKSRAIKGPRLLTPERRREIARKAANARWSNDESD